MKIVKSMVLFLALFAGRSVAGACKTTGNTGVCSNLMIQYAHFREDGIVEMGGAMPHTVAFAHGDVVHLDRDVVAQAGFPAVGVDVLGDGKRRRALAGVLDHIEAGLADGGKIELGIDVAQPRCGRRKRPGPIPRPGDGCRPAPPEAPPPGPGARPRTGRRETRPGP